MNFSHHSRPPTNNVHPPGVRLHIAQQDWKPRQGQANLLMSRHHRHSQATLLHPFISTDINGKKLLQYIHQASSRASQTPRTSELFDVFDHLTLPSHLNTYQYLHWINYHIWSQCLLLNQVRIPKQKSLAIEMAVPAASPVIMTWVDTI